MRAGLQCGSSQLIGSPTPLPGSRCPTRCPTPLQPRVPHGSSGRRNSFPKVLLAFPHHLLLLHLLLPRQRAPDPQRTPSALGLRPRPVSSLWAFESLTPRVSAQRPSVTKLLIMRAFSGIGVHIWGERALGSHQTAWAVGVAATLAQATGTHSPRQDGLWPAPPSIAQVAFLRLEAPGAPRCLQDGVQAHLLSSRSWNSRLLSENCLALPPGYSLPCAPPRHSHWHSALLPVTQASASLPPGTASSDPGSEAPFPPPHPTPRPPRAGVHGAFAAPSPWCLSPQPPGQPPLMAGAQ